MCFTAGGLKQTNRPELNRTEQKKKKKKKQFKCVYFRYSSAWVPLNKQISGHLQSILKIHIAALHIS